MYSQSGWWVVPSGRLAVATVGEISGKEDAVHKSLFVIALVASRLLRSPGVSMEDADYSWNLLQPQELPPAGR